jgi:hypothetical protein
LEIRITIKPPSNFAFAHVNFADSASREKAKKFYHGKKLGGKVLSVQDAITPSRK